MIELWAIQHSDVQMYILYQKRGVSDTHVKAQRERCDDHCFISNLLSGVWESIHDEEESHNKDTNKK